ncbi:hypothetical protein RsoM2USA_396 [Ralstonia phage RsoM2USA]|nr:hypothetical protein RsoM2USA_396 [Ralstonia phage RsoM2USA]
MSCKCTSCSCTTTCGDGRVKDQAASELKSWLSENAVMRSWGEYEGIADLNMAELGALRALVEAAIQEKIKNRE